MRFVFVFFIFVSFAGNVFSQGCCSGGSGSPIAGGTSQGVLQQGQVEIGVNHQYFNSNKFYAGRAETPSSTVSELTTNYLYTRIAYGITSKLTMSVEGGYFFDKTELGKDLEAPDYKKTSSGISDLIIFPRYDIYDKTNEKYHTEITLGIGLKIPVGTYNDSITVYINPSNGQRSYTTAPPTIQPTTGSNDFIFYGFALREFKKAKFKIFANTIYMRKGYNPLGEKFGDYGCIGLFASRTFFKKLGATLQLKYEWIDKMQTAKNVDVLALYNVDLNSTGSKKIAILPQLSYSFKSLSIFCLYDIPLYQYLNGFQIGSQYLVTTGITYRFMPTKSLWKEKKI